jgi:glycosyltransferase involved in cell wall biosynthesis
LRDLTSFTSGDVADLRRRLARLLALGDGERDSIRAAARRAAVERWSWASVADRLLALGR